MDRILRLLKVRQNEVDRLALAGTIFFLAAVNDGLLKSVAAAVFNFRVGVEALPAMYGWIAVLFALAMALLAALAAQVGGRTLLFGVLYSLGGLLFVDALLLWWQVQVPGFFSFLFISSELIRSLVSFQVWIVAAGICFTARAKVLFPLFTAGYILGESSGSFSVRLLEGLFSAEHFYLIAIVNMALIIALLRPLIRRYYMAPISAENRETASLQENLHYFADSIYLRLLFLLSLLVFGLYTVIHYAFNVIARRHLDTEAEIAGFFGLFYGITGVVTLGITAVLLSLILRWVGVRNIYFWVCVFYVLLGMGLAAVSSGWLEGWELMAFFAFNLANFLVLDSVIAPTYQVLMKLVPQRHGDGVRMVMEGSFMLLGGLLGAGLTGLHARAFVSMEQLFGLLVLLAAAMAFAAWRLRYSYTQLLVNAVRERTVDMEEAMDSLKGLMAKSGEFVRELLLQQDDGVRQLGIEMLRRNPGPSASAVCLTLFDHDNPRIREAALSGVRRRVEGLWEKLLPCLNDSDGGVRLVAAQALGEVVASDELSLIEEEKVIQAIAPRVSGEVAQAPVQAHFLIVLDRLENGETAQKRHELLKRWFASDQADAVIAGIGVVEKLQDHAFVDQMIRFCGHLHPGVREAAALSLGTMEGEGVLDRLLALLADPDPDVVVAAGSALARMDGPDEVEIMLKALSRHPLREWEGLMGALAAGDNTNYALVAALTDSCKRRLTQANCYLLAIDFFAAAAHHPEVELLIDQLHLQNRIAQRGVVRFLGNLSDRNLVGDLIDNLSAADTARRENAIELLENIADRTLMEFLLPLWEEDADTRREAAQACSGWDLVREEVIWEYLLATPDPWTQMAAVGAAACLGKLHFLEGISFGEGSLLQVTTDQIRSKIGEKKMAEDGAPLTAMEKITFLKRSPFFATLPLEELFHIAQSMQEEGVPAGTAVIEQGMVGDKMYIIVKGKMEVRKFAEDEDKVGNQVAVLAVKEVFGDMSLLDDEPRSASVIALEDGHLLSLKRTDLERILRRYSSIAFNMMRILSRRLREAMD